MLSRRKTKVYSFTLSAWLLFCQMIMPTPQLNEVTELKQLNNVSGVSIVDTTTEDATSKTDESQSSQVNSINIEESPSTVAN